MHQVSKPRAANQSMADESGRPGTCRSKGGWGGHRRSVYEKNGAAGRGTARSRLTGGFLPQEQLDFALAGPVLFAGGGAGRGWLHAVLRCKAAQSINFPELGVGSRTIPGYIRSLATQVLT